MLAFLRSLEPLRVASVFTSALILGAAGLLDRRTAATRRQAAGSETTAPLATRPPTKALAHESPTLSERAAGRIGHRVSPRAAFAGWDRQPQRRFPFLPLARPRTGGRGFPPPRR
jgi:hypothetical protein